MTLCFFLINYVDTYHIQAFLCYLQHNYTYKQQHRNECKVNSSINCIKLKYKYS